MELVAKEDRAEQKQAGWGRVGTQEYGPGELAPGEEQAAERLTVGQRALIGMCMVLVIVGTVGLTLMFGMGQAEEREQAAHVGAMNR